jgi:sister chromatid cohesion protein DCC1
MEPREIQFSPLFSSTNASWILMELPEPVLFALRNHQEVLIKGQSQDDAILCTESESYLIRSHETSNSLLVLDGLSVCKLAHEVLITEKILAPVDQIRTLLSQSPFTWTETSPSPVYTLADLQGLVQASRQEIYAELVNMHAFEWKGYWRVMEDQIRIETIKYVLHQMMKQHIGVASVTDLLREIQDLERAPLQACLASAGTVTEDLWTPDPLQLYRMCAIDLLLSKRLYFEEEFKTAFANLSDMLIPAKLVRSDIPLDSILAGIAIKKTDKGRSIYKYFPAEGLVKDFAGRLEQLFAAKEKWSQEELRPYVADIGELQQLLLKFTRRLVEDGVPYYTRKA